MRLSALGRLWGFMMGTSGSHPPAASFLQVADVQLAGLLTCWVPAPACMFRSMTSHSHDNRDEQASY